MKQTNNALKFLLAQYRAIFKNAYFKGIASAVVLTAGLAAGQAQAKELASGDFWQFQNKTTPAAWQERTKANLEAQSGRAPNISMFAGAIDTDGAPIKDSGNATINGKEFTIGASGDITTITVMKNNTGSTVPKILAAYASRGTTGSATISNNQLHLTNGGTITAATSLLGAYARSYNDVANGDHNEVIIDSGSSLASAAKSILGVSLHGYKGATADSNSVTINADPSTAGLQQNIYGAVVNSASDTSSNKYNSKEPSGSYVATNNTVTINNVKFVDFVRSSTHEDSHIAGGWINAGENSTFKAQSTLTSTGNSVYLNNVNVIQSDTKTERVIVANRVDNNSQAASKISSITANGSDGTGVTISDGSFKRSSVYGGFASNSSQSGANTTASDNNISINSASFLNGNKIIGGRADSKTAANTLALTANNNAVSITNDGQTPVQIQTTDGIAGASLALTSGGAGSADLVATGNSVTLSNSTVVTSDVYGALISGGGANVNSLSANNNSVTVAGEVTGSICAVATDVTPTDHTKFSALNNDVTLQSGADVKTGDLVGGAGKDSVVAIEAGATYTANKATQDISSDVVNIDGTIDIAASNTLNVAGYYEKGDSVAGKYNANLTSVGSSAVISNAGTLNLLGKVVLDDGAILTGAGSIFIDGNTANQANNTLAAEDQVEGAGFGSLTLSKAQLDSYLTADKHTIDGTTATDAAGAVVLTKGGVLEFTDESQIDLTGFKYANTVATPASVGTISVNSAGDVNAIKGLNLAISTQLPSSPLNLKVEAGTLTLGGGDDFTSATTNLGIKEALAQNVVFNADAKTGTTFTLKNNLTLSAITPAEDQYSFATADTGTITGNVIIDNDITETVKAGTYSNAFDITVASGGTLAIGGATATDEAYGVDASLTQTGALKLNGGNVVVSGNGTKEIALEDGTKDTHESVVALDLTNGTLSLSGTSSKFTADHATIYVNNVQVRQILGQNDDNSKSSALVTLNDGGVLDVAGEVRGVNGASIDVKQIGASGSNIKFAGAGTLSADEIWLKAATKATDKLALGSGTIQTDLLRLDTLVKNDGSYNDFLVTDGTLKVGEQIDVFNSFGSALVLNDTDLQLGWYEPVADGEAVKSAEDGTVQQNLKLNDDSNLSVNYGSWKVANIDLNKSNLFVGADKDGDQPLGYEVALTGQALTLDAGSTAIVKANGTATFDSISLKTKDNNGLTVNADGNATTTALSLEKGSNTVHVLGEMTVTGTESADNNHGINFASGSAIKVEGAKATLTFDSYAVQNITVNDDTVTLASGSFAKNIDITQNGTLALNFGEDVQFTGAAIRDLRNKLLVRTTGAALPASHIDLGAASLTGLEITDGFLSWKDYNDNFGDISDIKTEALQNATLKDVSARDTVNISVGNIRANSGVDPVQLGNVTLSTSSLNNTGDNFIFAADDPSKAVGATIVSGGNVTLEHGGNIGAITLQAGLNEDNRTSLHVVSEGEAITTIKGDLKASDNSLIDIQGTTNVTGSITADDLQGSAKLTAAGLEVNGSADYTGDLEINGATTFAQSAHLAGNNTFKDVTFNDNVLFDGAASEDDAASKAVLTTTADSISMATAGSTLDVGGNNTGYLMADHINLNGGSIIVDPDFSKAASIVTVNSLGETKPTKDVAGSLNGNAVALQNAILAIGVKSSEEQNAVAQVKDIFKKYLTEETGALQTGDDSVGSILYVAKTLDVTAGSKLIAASTLTREQYNTRTGDLANNIAGNDVYIGNNSALAINVEASPEVKVEEGGEGEESKEVTTTSTGAAINFQKNGASVYGSEGSKIILVGNYDARDTVKLFSDLDEEDDGKVAVASGSQDILVVTPNGELSYTIKAGEGATVDDIKLDFVPQNPDTPEHVPYAKASTPVRNTLLQYKDTDSDNGNNVNRVLSYDLQNGDGSVSEKVARLGAFGGAAQAAIAAGSTTYEAVSGRMGVGANGTNITVADNTQGAALWLTPVYKNRDSDGFGADGVEYGTDLDLYGVALGADYTLANGVKIGAAFNIGSGDADGNGAGEGVSNDFDYYGFAVYGGYTFGPWSVVADISYTNVDNDVEANTGITGVGKVGTSFDSSNLSVGVTGQYQAILDGDVTVTPHAGLRYTKIDLDDYTVHGENGDVAAYSSDDLSIFSIPFGVTVAKEFVNGTWTIKPSFDLTLTANMGDDSADGSVNWGVTGLDNTAVSSEVLDNFTYGATVGVAAKSGNFSLGFGLNYTGSSNTDEFGVNANARFVF